MPIRTSDGLTFGQAVARVSPEHRLLALLACGLVGGVGWVLIHRYGDPLVDIKKAVQDSTKEMPPLTTFIHATLQIITVGMGSPLGREVAPREASAGIMSGLLRYVDMRPEDKSLIIACAAGAGLAAVYNSPLSAAIYARDITYHMECSSHECSPFIVWTSYIGRSSGRDRRSCSVYDATTTFIW